MSGAPAPPGQARLCHIEETWIHSVGHSARSRAGGMRGRRRRGRPSLRGWSVLQRAGGPQAGRRPRFYAPAPRPSSRLRRCLRSSPEHSRGQHGRYEPKFDGFRRLLWHASNTPIRLLSRTVKDLSPWFPELISAGSALPPDTLVDGKIIIADERGSADFGGASSSEHGKARCGTDRREAPCHSSLPRRAESGWRWPDRAAAV